MPVLKTTSPDFEISSPKEKLLGLAKIENGYPSKTVPSARTRLPLFTSRSIQVSPKLATTFKSTKM